MDTWPISPYPEVYPENVPLVSPPNAAITSSSACASTPVAPVEAVPDVAVPLFVLSTGLDVSIPDHSDQTIALLKDPLHVQLCVMPSDAPAIFQKT